MVSLGETRWRMLRTALEYDVFCYHDLRQPSRKDVEHFDTLLDLGLFASAPPGATGTRRNTFAIKHRDPLGLFVVTDAGRKAAHMGLATEPPAGAEKPSLSIERRPEGGKEGRDWNHAAAPPVPVRGTLYHTAPPPVIAAAVPPAPTAEQYSPLVPLAKQPTAPPPKTVKSAAKSSKPTAKKAGKAAKSPRTAARVTKPAAK